MDGAVYNFDCYILRKMSRCIQMDFILSDKSTLEVNIQMISVAQDPNSNCVSMITSHGGNSPYRLAVRTMGYNDVIGHSTVYPVIFLLTTFWHWRISQGSQLSLTQYRTTLLLLTQPLAG